MASSKEKYPVFRDDLEMCKSQDRIKKFYEDCQSKYEFSKQIVTFNNITDYCISLLNEFINNDIKESVILNLESDCDDTGYALHKAGFLRVHGIVTDPKRLSLAQNKDIYAKVRVYDKNLQTLPFDNDIYDGIICTGVMFSSHLTISNAIPEFCRILHIGGYAMFSFDDNELDPRSLMSALGEAMFNQTLEICVMESHNFNGKDGVREYCYWCLVRAI